MSHLEEALLRRFSGGAIVVCGVVIALAGFVPWLLTTWLGIGEASGPTGLSMMALGALSLGGMGVVIGIIKLLVGRYAADEE